MTHLGAQATEAGHYLVCDNQNVVTRADLRHGGPVIVRRNIGSRCSPNHWFSDERANGMSSLYLNNFLKLFRVVVACFRHGGQS